MFCEKNLPSLFFLQVNLSGAGGNTVKMPRTMTTTTLTAQQLQQLANSRGQIISPALTSALRAGNVNPRTQFITTRPAAAGQTMLRAQQTASQRPALIQQQGHPRQQTIALQPQVRGQLGQAGAGQQIVVQAGGPGQPAGLTRQLVMTHQRQGGQILQVSQGGQIVVSQSGQIIINPPSSKS